MDLETIEFTTPAKKTKAKKVETKLDLVGETYTVSKPKDAVLFFAQSAVADTANDADRWMAALQFLDAAFTPMDRKRFFERACDAEDPLTAGAVFDAIGSLLDRWAPTNKTPANAPVKVEPHPDTIPAGLQPVRIVNDDLNLDLTCHPPKDLVLGITSAAIATGANTGQQAWCIALFLDAALSPHDTLTLDHRMRSHNDDLDLDDVAGIVQALIERWYPDGPQPNRKARRATNARTRKTTRTTGQDG